MLLGEARACACQGSRAGGRGLGPGAEPNVRLEVGGLEPTSPCGANVEGGLTHPPHGARPPGQEGEDRGDGREGGSLAAPTPSVKPCALLSPC